MLATYILLQLLNVLWTSRPHSFQPGRTNILGSLIKAWNDSFNKRRKKKKKHPFLIPRHQGCEVLKSPLTSSSVEAQMAGSSIRSQVGITQFFEVWGMHYYYHTWPKDTVLLSGLLHATHTSGGAFFFFRCCCSSSSLFLRVLGLPCSLFRSWQFQFLEWFTFHR